MRGTLQQVVDLAVVSVAGCDAAGISVVEDEKVTAMAFSDPVVIDLDALQVEVDQARALMPSRIAGRSIDNPDGVENA